jgi:hypothetical protein
MCFLNFSQKTCLFIELSGDMRITAKLTKNKEISAKMPKA